MSLKHFHMVFISVALIISVIFGYWSLMRTEQLGLGALPMALASFALGAGLAIYSFEFVKKVH